MPIDWRSLAAVGAVPAEAWDAVVPKHLVHTSVTARGAAVSLNPQPLPPREAVVGSQLLQNVLAGAIIIEGGRDGTARALLADIEDWCGTGWPRRWPQPPPPDPWDPRQVFVGAAVAAAGLAMQYGHDAEMQEALGAAAERLLEQAAHG